MPSMACGFPHGTGIVDCCMSGVGVSVEGTGGSIMGVAEIDGELSPPHPMVRVRIGKIKTTHRIRVNILDFLVKVTHQRCESTHPQSTKCLL